MGEKIYKIISALRMDIFSPNLFEHTTYTHTFFDVLG